MPCFKHISYLFIFFLSFCLYPNNTYGQVDSLISVAQHLPDGKEKVDVWLEIGSSLEYTDFDKCALYCDSIEALATKINYERGKNKGLFLRSSILNTAGKNIDALAFAKTTMAYAVEHQDTQLLITRHNRLGSIYSELELFEKASEHFLSCAELSELNDNIYTAAVSYYNLGTVFFDLDNLPKARKYILLAINLLEKDDNYDIHGVLYDALAGVTEDEDEAYKLHLKGLNYCLANETPYFLTAIYNNIGVHFKNKHLYDKAIENFHLSLQYANEYENVEFITHASENLGGVFLIENQLDSALFYNLKGLEIAEKNGYSNNQQTLNNQLSELYSKKGNFEKAYNYSQKAFEVRDSIYQSDIEQQMQVNADQFQLERKEKHITEQDLELAQSQNSRNRMIIIGLLLLSLIIAAYQWYLFQQQKRKQAVELKLNQEKAESLRLREVDKLKTNFFTNISHELRTPLTLILSPITDIMETVQSKPIRSKLGIIQRNGQRLLNLVNEIMDLSKIEVGKLEIHQSNIDLIPLIKRIFSNYESLADIRRIQYKMTINLEDKFVLLDREKFEKILNNLLSNALKYTNAGGKVSFNTFLENKHYIFEIRDTGQGIHSDEQAHIFDRFYQAESSSHSLQGGTGIGLALAKELSHLLKGEITVESELGKGSCFRFIVPLQSAPRNAAKQIISKDKTPEQLFVPSYIPISIKGNKPRLLIVEDHPEMGKYLLEILSDHYQCVLANDGLEALKQLKINAFDCITSDVMMPNMDGFTLREHINEHAEWRQIPFLLLTARHLEDDKLKGFQLGIDDYITKPFSTKELHARIHNLISNKLERDSFQNTNNKEEALSVDQSFLKKLEQTLWDHLDDEQFKVEDLAATVHYSPKQLGRLLKKHTGMSSVQFILEIRLQKAREMLEKRLCSSVGEVQYAVGIQSISYFTRKFTERFGKNPKAFL